MIDLYEVEELRPLISAEINEIQFPTRRKANFSQRLELGCFIMGLMTEEEVDDEVDFRDEIAW